MELKIKETSFPEVIEFNFDEIKNEVTSKVALYKNLVYTEDKVVEAKTDKASLNKFIKALEDKRKEIKKECLKPYESFEKQVKEIVAIVEEPVAIISEQVAAFEEKEKQEKREQIAEFYAECDTPDGLLLEDMFNDKWLNKSYSMKQIKEDIQNECTKFSADLETLDSLSDFAFEAKEHYMRHRDLNSAIAEGKRLKKIQDDKAIFEQKQREKKQEQEKAQSQTLNEYSESVTEKTSDETEASGQWVTFKAYMTVQQALELKQFFDDRLIIFRGGEK